MQKTDSNCRWGRYQATWGDAGLLDLTLNVKPEKHAPVPDSEGLFAEWRRALAAWLEQPETPPEFPFCLQGTSFQLSVWQTLQTIPWGERISYSQLAQRVGCPQGVRAVASACARNRLALVIPCHRVVAKSGELGGYRWGVELKQQLLDYEQQVSR